MTEHRSQLALNGGQPVRSRPWPNYMQGTGGFGEATKKEIMRVLDSGRLFRYDSRSLSDTAAGRLESALAEYFGSKHVLLVSSGTAALTLALLALDLPQGFEAVCPAFGFPATASAILMARGIPRLIAVDRDLHFSLPDLERRWNERIKAIIVVHMRGFASQVDAIVEFATSRGVHVIEDVVPAFGARLEGKLLGTFGRVGCFSTQSDKMINTGEGGFLITDDLRLCERAVLLSGAFEGNCFKHFADLTSVESEFNLPLFNFRIDELRAALALCQLQDLDMRISTLRRNYEYVAGRVSELPGIRLREPVESGSFLGDSLVFFVDPVVQSGSRMRYPPRESRPGLSDQSEERTSDPSGIGVLLRHGTINSKRGEAITFRRQFTHCVPP
ncbi:MAG: aminotransferase class I/II-fold pyridoxal phosphate-dependent enzyme [Candidatus Zixiibacteriota bacterium]